jgi:hypothetical protein
MANSEIKQLFGASTEFSITTASLANGAGRSSALVDNETTRWGDITVYWMIETVASAVADSTVDLYAIRSDDATANTTTDGVTADAAYTPVNAKRLDTIKVNGSGGAQVLQGEANFPNPGKEFGVAIFNNTGQILHATEANCKIWWVGRNPEVQIA